VTDQLRAATRRLVRTVDALTDDDWAAPSLLPTWTRAHVVAHLALNAEAYAGALLGLLEGQRVPMYASDERRDADIADLATETPTGLRDRLFASVTRLSDVLGTLDADPSALAGAIVDRTPDGSRRFPAEHVGAMRLREVEIHHADLGCAYSPTDWPGEFSRALLEETSHRHQDSVNATLVATDLDWSLRLGNGYPTVTGPAHGLAWWLTGRTPYPGAEVTSDDGVLPRIEGL
jgi:maleylpyruvate isomerase